MRAVIQRVSEAKVEIDGKINGEIGKGFLVLIAVHNDDEISDIDYMVNKISKLRVFEDDEGKMNLSLTDIGGELLIVSQFTLYGDSRKGNRPSFIHSAKPPKSVEYYEEFLKKMRETVDVDGCLAKGDFGPINAWNRERIWQYGGLYAPGALLEKALGAPFDPTVYTDYLEKKYAELYGL